jgi:predicted aspartyl protease
VTSDVYARAELQALSRRTNVAILDITADTDEVLMKTLQFNTLSGPVTLENIVAARINPFQLISKSPRMVSPGGGAPEGWLGAPFFTAFQVSFDVMNHQVTLNKPNTPLPKEAGAIEVPFEIREGRIWVKVSVPKGKTFQAMVDTGAVGTLLPGEIAEKMGLKPINIVTVTRGAGQEAKAALAVMPEFSLGKAKVKDVPVVFLAANAPAPFDRKLGVLGLDFLSHFVVTLDYGKKKMVLVPPAAPDAPTNPEP